MSLLRPLLRPSLIIRHVLQNLRNLSIAVVTCCYLGELVGGDVAGVLPRVPRLHVGHHQTVPLSLTLQAVTLETGNLLIIYIVNRER